MSEIGAGTWAAMGSPAYRRLFFSTAIVIFGVMGQSVARGWLARELTGTNTGLGGVMLVFGVAMLVATPFGGAAADRYRRRDLLVGSVAVLMVSSLAIGVAVVTDVVQYWMLLVASAAQAAAFAYYLPARIALIAEILPSSAVRNGIVVAQMAQEAMRVIAPALAGVLVGVAWFGVGGVFLAAGISSAVAAVLVVPLPPGRSRVDVERSPLGEMADAIRYIRATPGLASIAIVTVAVVMVGFPYLTFLPTLADDFGVGATGYGVMSAVAGAGALGAGLVDSRVNRGVRPWHTISFAAIALGVSLLVLGVANSYVVALVALAAVGAAGLVFQTSAQALMLRLSAIEYHGRLQSFVILGFSGFGLAALPLGLVADAISLGVVLVGMGSIVVTCGAGFAMTRVRARRRLAPVDFG